MLFAFILQLTSLLPPPLQQQELIQPLSATSYQLQVLELSNKDTYLQSQLKTLRPYEREQQIELAALLPYATLNQARLIAVLASGCAGNSILGDALIQLSIRSRNLDVRIACLLAPLDIPAHYLPALACMSLTSHLDLALRAVACGRLLEHGYYSAWPLARAILLTGTAADSDTPHAFPEWLRSGRYELPKRLLSNMLQQHLSTKHDYLFVFEANAAWQVQEQQVATVDAVMKTLPNTRSNDRQLSTWLRLRSSDMDTAKQALQLLGL
jgi:hypothetical protein